MSYFFYLMYMYMILMVLNMDILEENELVLEELIEFLAYYKSFFIQLFLYIWFKLGFYVQDIYFE